MGGKLSVGFLAPAGSGANTLVSCVNSDYAADFEVARAVPRAPTFPEALDAPEDVETPGVATIDELAELLGIDPAATSKAMPVVSTDGTLVLVLVRGDDRLSETKLYDALPGSSRPAQEEEIRSAFGAGGGSIGPLEFAGPVLADETLREGQYVAGANRDGWHVRGVEAGRDFSPRFADLREPREGDACGECGGTLRFRTAIEVGHIFLFGTFYSGPLDATFLDEEGREQPLLGGSYGVGPGRVMAAIVEQHHDERGIAWPRPVAPYDAHVVCLPGLEEESARFVARLEGQGMEVLFDDRDLRAGEKFADADLIGCPTRATVGKKTLDDGMVDLRDRATSSERRVALQELVA
jgi:prolyl-tRNA synthetase